MTKLPPKSNVAHSLGLSADQYGQLLVAAEAALREEALEYTHVDLSGVDLKPSVDLVVKLALRYEDIMVAIAKLPTVNSALKYALRHESQHALDILAMKTKTNASAPAVTAMSPAPKSANAAPQSATFHLNLVLPQEWDHELSEVGYRCRTLGGRKVTKTEVLRGLIRLLLQDLHQHLDLNQVKTEDDFLDRLRRAAKKL